MKVDLYNNDIKDVFNFKYFYTLPINKNSKYGFHLANYSNEIPKKMISLNYAKTTKNIQDYYIHFFIDDYQFERVYKYVDKWFNILKNSNGIISPDFSLYANMPRAYQVFQVYKTRFIESYYSNKGVKVIPRITWSDKESLDYVLDGLDNIEVFAVTTNGLKYYKELQKEFIENLLYVIEKLNTKKVLIIGFEFEELKILKDKVEIIFFDNYKQQAYKKIQGRNK